MQIMPRPPQPLLAGFWAGLWLRLVFIHTSVGENWLNPDLGSEVGGALLPALNANNYFVSDSYNSPRSQD
jgi:hypothetical protein